MACRSGARCLAAPGGREENTLDLADGLHIRCGRRNRLPGILILVRDGKGQKDRVTLLPATVKADIASPDYSRIPDSTLTRALSHRGRGAHFLIPSPRCGRGTG